MIKLNRLFCVALLATCYGGTTAVAQTVTVNQDTKEISISASDPVVDIDGYAITSASGQLSTTGWSSLNSNAVDGWEELLGTVNELSEFDTTAATVTSLDSTISFGAAWDDSSLETLQLAAGLGVDVRDVAFTYVELNTGIETAVNVIYTGDADQNNIVLRVDTGTGNVMMVNESPHMLTIDGYTILSSAGSLDTSWDGLRDTETDFVLAGNTANGLGEINGASSLTLNPNDSFDLGSAFTASGTQDLVFDFLQVGDANPFRGVVEYTASVVAVDGDYNNDGTVDAADYTVWRDNLGTGAILPNDVTPGVVDESDFNVWRSNYGAGGAGAGSASVASVPEPTSAMLIVVCGLASVCGLRRRN